MESEIQGDSQMQDQEGHYDSQHHEDGHYDSPDQHGYGDSEMHRYGDEEEGDEHQGEYDNPDMEEYGGHHGREDGDEHHEYDQSGHQEGYEDGHHDQHDGEDDEGHGHSRQEDTSREQRPGDESFTGQVVSNQLRRAKRDILDNLNRIREDLGMERFNVDLYSDLIAEEYAQYLTRGEHNMEFFKSLHKDYNLFGEVELVHTISRFEEDVEISADVFYQEFIDLGHLLLEVESDRKIILHQEYNNIGVGVATTQNGDRIILVQVFSKKMIAITRINDGEDGGIEVRGRMLKSTHGVFAVRLQNLDTRKDIVIIGPPNIEFNPKGKEFTAILDCDETIGSSNKIIELYVRGKPEEIEYAKPSKDKINLKHVELVIRCPCIPYPDPKYLTEDEKDKMRLENEKQMKSRSEEEARIRREQERLARKEHRKIRRKEIDERRANGEDIESLISSRSEQSMMSKARSLQGKKAEAIRAENKDADGADEEQKSESKLDGDGNKDDRSDDDDRMDYQKRQSMLSPEPIKDQEITNEKIMQELRQALAEALEQKGKLVSENEELQGKIYDLKKRKEGANAMDKQTGSDVSGMNEHKYMNTLAHVHQIRIDLKQTQDRYNKMAAELQSKLDEKQKKCNEIKQAFKELKGEVARKAAFSRTDKPIPEKMIEEWERNEDMKNKELQALRLENLRLRNTLAKNQKILKKKEELAEGLHLIDFEQLKIENQTLNEKIEERNEDLHKLKKKNTTTVQILTHTKEKLQFETKTNEKLQGEGEDLENSLNKLREILSRRKGDRDEQRVKNQELRQKTLIFNSKSLKKDYELMEKRLRVNAAYLQYLKDKRSYMEGIVTEFNADKTKTQGGSVQNGYSMTGSHKIKHPMK